MVFPLIESHVTRHQIDRDIPWFGWPENEEAATTDDWADVDRFAFTIHPAKALTLAAGGAGVNGCIKLSSKRKGKTQIYKN